LPKSDSICSARRPHPLIAIKRESYCVRSVSEKLADCTSYEIFVLTQIIIHSSHLCQLDFPPPLHFPTLCTSAKPHRRLRPSASKLSLFSTSQENIAFRSPSYPSLTTYSASREHRTLPSKAACPSRFDLAGTRWQRIGRA
jgi:hypothetical protein